MGYFHASKGEAAFLAWPITPGNSVKYFATCVEYVHNLFTIPHFVLSFPMKTTVSSVHFIAAIIIRRSVFCTITFSLFHIISIAFRPVINVVTIISSDNIIARICSASSALLRYKRSVKAVRNYDRTSNTDRRDVSLRYRLPNTTKQIRSGTRNPPHRLLRSNTGGYLEVRQRTRRNNQSRLTYVRDTQRPTEG